jgi:hypothetical protein
MLLAAKERCILQGIPWHGWLRDNCPGLPLRTAQDYMRLAKEDMRKLAHTDHSGEEDTTSSEPSDGRLWSVDCADCLGWFAARPAGSIDLVFGSPPYEQARLYLEGGRPGRPNYPIPPSAF